jgi:hypothetical protein
MDDVVDPDMTLKVIGRGNKMDEEKNTEEKKKTRALTHLQQRGTSSGGNAEAKQLVELRRGMIARQVLRLHPTLGTD